MDEDDEIKHNLKMINTHLKETHQNNKKVKREKGTERYSSYTARLGQLVRYLAYTSDVGESFRPIMNKFWVRAAYGISWGYVLGECTYESYQEKKRGESNYLVFRTFVTEFAFQSIASMAIPAFTIHTVVKQSHKLFKRENIAKHLSQKVKIYGPTGLGLMVVPFLPIVDHPVEHVLHNFFNKFWHVEAKKHDEKKEH